MFIKNCWYVAAWSHDVAGDKPKAVRVLDQPMVLFRTSKNEIGILEDRCCHRSLPLAQGSIEGDQLRCGYHGLLFDKQGACTEIPGQKSVPPTARVRSYPVHERDKLIWVWMGDPTLANSSEIVPFPWHNDPEWRFGLGTVEIGCDYRLMLDNLMDLSHLAYVHTKTIGGQPNVHSNAEMKTSSDGDYVKVERWMLNADPAPLYKNILQYDEKIDRWQEIEFWPSVVHIHTGACPANTGAREGKREHGRAMRLIHAVTPVTADQTIYFWSAGHNFRLDEPDITQMFREQFVMTFEEDKVVLEAQNERLKGVDYERQLHVRSDAGGRAMRRVLARRAAEENKARSTVA